MDNRLPLWQTNDDVFFTTTDAVADVIEDYATNDEDLALEERWNAACFLADSIQKAAVDHYRNTGAFDALSDKDKVLATAPRTDVPPVPWPREWPYEVPLYVVSTDFEPVTDVPLPAGNVKVIDPMDEVSFLDSVGALGFIVPTRIEENW